MAFTNFTELKNSVIQWAHRDDIDLLVQDFITLAEFEMFNNEVKALELSSLETTVAIPTVTSTPFISLPSDYSSMRSARFDVANESGFLQYRAPQQLKRYDVTGRPCFFTVIGGQIEFDRTPDEIINTSIQYYAKVTALTPGAPTNLVLTSYPNLYLFGALANCFVYADDNEKAGKYKGLFMSAIAGANKADKKGRFGPAPQMKVEGSTP